MPRFTDEELESFVIDPREPAAWSRCPFCGQDIVMGTRKDSGNITLAHSSSPDPTDQTGRRHVTACEPFNKATTRDDVIRFLYESGARFQKLVSDGPG